MFRQGLGVDDSKITEKRAGTQVCDSGLRVHVLDNTNVSLRVKRVKVWDLRSRVWGLKFRVPPLQPAV
jgi:hypothetical protein